VIDLSTTRGWLLLALALVRPPVSDGIPRGPATVEALRRRNRIQRGAYP